MKIRIKKASDVKEKRKIKITGFTSINLTFGMKKGKETLTVDL